MSDPKIRDNIQVTSAKGPTTNGSPKHSVGCADLCPYQRGVLWLLVAAQFLLVGVLLFLQPSARQHFSTLVIHVTGIALGLWAVFSMGRGNINVSPAVRENASLVERGPYRLVRHPMYTALLLFMLSYVIADVTPLSVQAWLGLLLVLVVKSLYEESLLTKRFPSYVEYKQRTWRFLPYVI